MHQNAPKCTQLTKINQIIENTVSYDLSKLLHLTKINPK